MALVRAKGTGPEKLISRLVRRLGYKFRRHARSLPGTPDFVFASKKSVIFVHGCFWHRHAGRCALARLPKSRLDFWVPKLEENRKRDQRTRRALRTQGWRSLVIWECQLSDTERLKTRLAKFLSQRRKRR
jgi:DNA mismatch endonuclease (patch repair protein)